MSKKIKLIGMLSLSGVILATNGAMAYADNQPTPEGGLDYANSDVKVKIKVPNINDVDTLAFDEVPDAFDFGLVELATSQNSVSSSIQLADTKISVYKDYDRNDQWEVKAVASNLTDGKDTYELNSFKLNNQTITGTGENPVILKSDDKNNGKGTYSYDINTADIDFKLPTQKKEGITQLDGTVMYSLSVIKAAE